MPMILLDSEILARLEPFVQGLGKAILREAQGSELLGEPVAYTHPKNLRHAEIGFQWCREVLLYSPHGQDETHKTHVPLYALRHNAEVRGA